MINDNSKRVIAEYLKLTPEERDGFHDGIEILEEHGVTGAKKRGRPPKPVTTDRNETSSTV